MRPQTRFPDRVLAVNLTKTDRRMLAALSDTTSWRLVCTERLAPALRKLASRVVRVVLYAPDLPDAHWQVLFERVRDLAHTPRFILVSRLADECLWAEVLDLGYDVLATPFRGEEAIRVLSFAMAVPLCRAQALPSFHRGSS